ncbi:TPA: replication protein P [Photobacterium damselae]
MKTMDNTTNNVGSNQGPSPGCSPQPRHRIDDFAAQNINEIFKELCSVLPAWRQHLRTLEEFKATRASFAKGMMENGITTMEQVYRGLARARQQESNFFPSVGKFCAWCQDQHDWQEAFKRMIERLPSQSLAEQVTRRRLAWKIRHLLTEYEAIAEFKKTFLKNQALEQLGQLKAHPYASSPASSEIDRLRDRVQVLPEQFEKDSVFYRVARKGMSS